jgi:integrase
MPNVNLTTTGVERAKPPKSGRRELWDSVVPGFHIRITDRGTKTYAVMARLHGKQFRMALGRHGVVSLTEARQKARDVLSLVEAGKDPREDRLSGRSRSSEVVEDVVEDFIERHVRRHTRPRSAVESERVLRNRAAAKWKGRSIKEISRRDIIDLLDEMAEKTPGAANRARAVISKFFNWCLDRGIIDLSPAIRLPSPGPINERDRVLVDDELKILWSAFESLSGPINAFFEILLLTGQRRGEVATMQWEHLDFENAVWTIPREFVKADRVQEVPLSPLAAKIILNIERRGDYVFTTRPNGDKSFSGFSKAKIMIDKKAVEIAQDNAERRHGEPRSIPNWRIHDLRRTCGTGMARLGVESATISRVLNHAEGGVTKIYNRYSYLNEKRHALDVWGAHLESVTGAAPDQA